MSARSGRAPRDTGTTLVELLVAMVLAGVVIGLIIGAMTSWSKGARDNGQRVTTTTTTDDANLRLGNDISEATGMLTAESQRLVLTVIRNERCAVVDWHVNATAKSLDVTTTTYEGRSCSGASTTGTKAVLRRYVQSSTFSYWGESATYPLDLPLTDTREVRRVAWDLAAAPYVTREAPPVTMSSSAVYMGRPQRLGTGSQALQAKAPLLSVTTAREGVDLPQLTWVDPTPAITQSWVVARATGPEDGKDTSYQPVAWLTKDQLTWTDTGLQAGYRGTYLVLATLSDGSQGPSSNVVDTGLRPPQVQGVTATGQPTSIRVDWAPAVGATGYDVYRDGVLVAGVGRVASWTDPLTYGHSHTYQVVGVNLWEDIATTGDPHVRVAAGHKVGDALRGATRLASAPVGAFTAPAAPSLTATPTGTSAGATYSTTLTWAAAAWTGAGPTADRDRDYTVQSHEDASATFSNLWAGVAPATPTHVHAARTPGGTDTYQATTCNAVGCSPWSGAAASLQRPPAPSSCSIPASSTRGQQVVVNAASAPSSPTSYTLAHTAGDGAATGTGTQASPTFNVDGLAHGQWHSYAAYASNGSGDSPAVGCSAATATLTVAAATCTASSIDTTAPGGFVISGGDQVKLGSGGTVYSSLRAYGSLSAGTYRGYAQNNASDGYNAVSSGWDACSSVTIVGPPPTPSGAQISGEYGTGPGPAGFNVITYTRIDITSQVGDATRYEAYMTYTGAQTSSDYTAGSKTLVANTGFVYLGSCEAANKENAVSPQFHVRAGNGAGWSGWYTFSPVKVSHAAGCS